MTPRCSSAGTATNRHPAAYAGGIRISTMRNVDSVHIIGEDVQVAFIEFGVPFGDRLKSCVRPLCLEFFLHTIDHRDALIAVPSSADCAAGMSNPRPRTRARTDRRRPTPP